MSLLKSAFAIVVCLTAAACSSTGNTVSGRTPSPDTAQVRTALESANRRFVDAFKKGDKAGLLANYADDAVLMMPNEPAVRGHAALDAAFTATVAQMTLKEGGATTSDVMVVGDVAVETGTFAWTFALKDGSEIKDQGKYVTVWAQQADGSWKILRDINNSDLPADH